MSQKILFVVLLSFVFVSGCLSDPTAIARALPEINNFLEENPNADITVVVWSGPDSEFEEVCGTTPPSEPLYYVIMVEGEDRAVAWIEIDSQQLVCLKKFGREVDEREDDILDDLNVLGDSSRVVVEDVTCVFDNSDSTQRCYADDGSWCSGVGSCVVNVDGYLGDKLAWKSSCEGLAFTVMDGDRELARFDCGVDSGSIFGVENVTCVFDGSDSTQRCYADSGVECSGVGSCVISIEGYFGSELTWRSSCGGYAFTFIDGENEHAKFECGDGVESIFVVEDVTCV
ncbi:hypothetical protein IIC68_02955, partial [archaeon]|nr:hypothetical protein [archaeon]